MESLENENPTIQVLGRVRFTVVKLNVYYVIEYTILFISSFCLPCGHP